MPSNLMNIYFKAILTATLAVPYAATASDLAILHNGFSIRHERREVIGAVTRLYLGAEGSGYVDVASDQIEQIEKDLTPVPPPPAPATPPPANPLFAAPNQPRPINDVINSASDRNHIDPDLINSVIHAESGFNTRAVSQKGARGLMQLMPQTALHLGVTNSFDPGANVEGGTRYLRELLEKYNFDLVKALAAYNAGPGRVQQYHGVPPYYETQLYVARIIREYNRKKLAQRKLDAKVFSSPKHNQARGAKQDLLPGAAEQAAR